MAKKFSIKKLKEKQTGASDAELSKIALKAYGDKFAKQELPNAEELKSILEAFPLSYLDLKDKALQEMIMFSNEALYQAEKPKEFDLLATGISPEKQAKFLKQEELSWNQLKDLKNDPTLSPRNHDLDTRDISISLLRLKFIEDNWPKDKLTSLQANQLKNAQVLLAKINKLTYSEATKLGFGTRTGEGSQIKPNVYDIDVLLKMAEQDHTINLKLVRETYIDLLRGESKISIEWEDSTLNKFKSGLSALVNKQIRDVYDKQSKMTKTVFDNLDIMNVESSPTFLLDMENMLTTAILGKKVPKRKRKAVSKTQYKLLRSQKVKSAKRKLQGKTLPRLPTFKQIKADVDLPLYSIMALINEVLAEQVKDNMGESNDAPVLLRNQTGRFAESARLLTLTRSKAGALAGTYTYQRDPYDVFLPGHKLGTPKRNPKVYLEGSIREVAIAIMKRKFPGLTLELI